MAHATGRVSGVVETIVDTDAHVTEQVEDVLPYIDAPRGVRNIIAKAERPMADIFSRTHAQPTVTPGEETDDRDSTATKALSSTRDLDAKLADLDEFDIEYGVVTPTLHTLINTVENTRCAVALANAYNSWVLDQHLDEYDALKATIVVPPQMPEKAAEEIDDRADERDMVGVMLPSSGLLPPAGHRRYDPIYEAAEDHGLPVVMHGANSAFQHSFPTQRRWNETKLENHVITHPFGHMWNVTTMMAQGVPARYPDLEFVVQEAGIGWIPYLMWRLDDEYMARPHEAPFLDRLPSEYMRDQFYYTTQPLGHTAGHPEHLARMIEMVGTESIMYASDIPHHDFDPPEELFDRIRPHFDDETVNDVMGATALELFDLD
ncbi:MAG: amidohydrolase family protein [Haloferacaceae archaeon]